MNKFNKFEPSNYIQNDNQANEYLQTMLEENGIEGFLRALGHIAKAKGMSKISQETGLGRESLYKSLSEDGNPKFDTVLKTLNALDIDIKFENHQITHH